MSSLCPSAAMTSRRRSFAQIENYEAEEERKRKERDEAAAGEGWTVVKRHKVRAHLQPRPVSRCPRVGSRFAAWLVCR